MKTSLDPVQILYARVTGSELAAKLTGKTYKMTRPTGSKLEDIVVNGLPITADQFQIATANVNLYVPDLTVQIKGVTQMMPDTARLGYLAGLAVDLLSEYYEPTFRYSLTGQHIIAEEESAQHYINLRVDFEFFPES